MVNIFCFVVSGFLFSPLALAQGEFRAVETGGGSNYVGFKSPASITTSLLWTLPTADGVPNACFATNASGTLSWGVAVGGDLKADGSVSMTGPMRLFDGTLAAPSFTFTGGSQGFRYVSATEMAYVSGGADRWSFTNLGYGKSGTVGAWVLMSPSTVTSPTYAFGNDTDAGLYHPGADQMGFVTAGVEVGRINATGIGIGTTAPAAALDINGEIRLKKNSSAPAVCAAALEGRVSLTSVYTLCVCNGAGAAWVRLDDGSTACTW